jgi:short-subunit dehydrogenase
MTVVPNPLHVLITGASSGIGAALAAHYARPGVELSLLARNRERLDTVARACRARGAGAQIHVSDVTDAQEMQRVVLACDRRHAIDLVIANAGIGGAASMTATAEELAASARPIFEINLMGVVHTVTPLVPCLVARRSGQIAIMGSFAGLVGLPQAPVYSASKAALRVYAHGLRRLLMPHGVGVSIICPAFVDTPMSASLPFRPPLTWNAERAAGHIAAGLARGKREILFPWPLALAARFLTCMPAVAVDWLLTRLQPRIRGR